MMLEDSAEAQLEVLDQPAGPEALVIGGDDLDDPDLAGFQQVRHGRLELTQVVTTQPARNAYAGHSLRHIWQYFNHRIFPPSLAEAASRYGSVGYRVEIFQTH
jgi:hypothetical protein